VPSIDQARPGDLIAFGQPVDHIAIYVGDGKIIHAPRTGDVVKIADIHRTPTAIRRIVPETGSTSGASPVADGLTPLGDAQVPVAQRNPQVARFSGLFAAAEQRYGVSANLLAAIATVESGGNPDAVSSAGARGLMQFMPGTARAMGIDPSDPAQAVDGAARLLVRLRDSFGSIELALAAYNAGEGAVRRAGGIPPYGETQSYVAKVMGLLGGTT
jgi:soluble lytic murein transglycosylase-like protein